MNWPGNSKEFVRDSQQSLGIPRLNANPALSGAGINPLDINLEKSWDNNPWIKNNLPQFRADDPYHFKLGGYNIDWRDPRILASIIMPGANLAGSSAYAIGRQQGIQKEDKRLEGQYAPTANREAGMARQNATYSGLNGGSGNAMAQGAFDQIMALLEEEKRNYRKRQNEKEAAAISQLLGLLGGAVGMSAGPAGAMAGYSAGTAAGQTVTPLLY